MFFMIILRRIARICALHLVLLLAWPAAAAAGQAVVAAASNFSTALTTLIADFEAGSDHRIRAVIGSTGKLYAQIANGAPFDVFLAADQARPAALEHDGLAVAGTRFTYAQGQLVLWRPAADPSDADIVELLSDTSLRSIAMANPALAPYGEAARQTLQSLQLWVALQDRLVFGENIGQTFSLVATRNADLGFIAQAQFVESRFADPVHGIPVPAELHDPIRQDAVLLARAVDKPAAVSFVRYLKSAPARRIIRAAGYRLDGADD
jgi:molybdate transport system substrate-binding protein